MQANGSEVLFAPVKPLVQHLANAEQFAIEKSMKGFGAHDTFKMLVKIDEAIRGNWCKQLRQGLATSLGAVIKEQEAFATALWLNDPQVSQTRIQGKTKGDNFKGEKQLPWLRDPSSSFGYDDKNGAQLAIQDAPGVSGKGKGKRTAQMWNGKPICKQFNDNRGCRDAKCNREHRCDFLLPNGQPCGATHSRINHEYQR